MILSFTPVDPTFERIVHDVFALRTAAHAVDAPHLPRPCFADFEGSLAVPPPSTAVEEWAGYDGHGRCVASVRLEFPLEDGADSVTASVLVVHPSFRRRGQGGLAVEFAGERARARGRSRITFVTDTALHVHELGAPHPDAPERLAARLGARSLTALRHLRLDVRAAPRPEPVDEPLRVRYWGSTIPEDLLDDAARLEAVLAGTPALDPDPAAATAASSAAAAGIRDFERMRLARGRRAYQCGIVDGRTGRMVAWTALSMTRDNPDNALQAITVVDPAHRGRGLGRQVKALNLVACRAAEPALTHVDTWNAADNDRMLRVNADFGFTPAGTKRMWEVRVEAPLRAAEAARPTPALAN